MSLKKT